VATFAASDLRPERFAEYANVVGHWFYKPMIIWEGSGPGSDFGGRLHELNYNYLYRMRKTNKQLSEKYGWFAIAKDSWRRLHTDLSEALFHRTLTQPDALAVNECLQFQWDSNQKLVHQSSYQQPDPSGAKKNHGDRATAMTLMWFGMKTQPTDEILKPSYTEASRFSVMMDGDDDELPYW
jgi:hypothetical protein